MFPSHHDDKKKATSSSVRAATDSDKRRGMLGGTHFGGINARPGGAVRVQSQLSKPGVKDEASSGTQVLHMIAI